MKKRFLPEMPALPARLRTLLPGSTTGAPTLTLPGPSQIGPDPAGPLALAEVRGNLAIARRTVTAWFTVAEAVWPFQPDTERETMITSAAAQYAALAGIGEVHLRRTNVPFPVAQWAAKLTANARPLPDDLGFIQDVDAWVAQLDHAGDPAATLERPVFPSWAGTTWQQHVAAAAARLAAEQYTTARTQIGVTFPLPKTRRGRDVILSDTLTDQIQEVTARLAVGGLAARPSTPDEMLWLVHRSVSPGLPATDDDLGVDPDDAAQLADLVEWQRGAYAPMTHIIDRRTGQSVHVAVLTVGRMEALTIPQVHEPWAHLSAQLDFPVEWSSRFHVLPPAVARGGIEHRMKMILSQQQDYADHGDHVPLELGRLADRAAAVIDQIDAGRPEDAARVHGYHRMAVSGDTRQQCRDRVRAVIRAYNEIRVDVVHTRGQALLLREFIPGEPTIRAGHVRRMPVKMMAAAVPQATARVGDDRGDLIGVTATSGTRPVFWDPHFAMEVRERSGLTVFVSEPGGGKSTLLGALGYLNARRGVQVTLMDPSGPLARLARMPELRPYTRVVDLVGSEPGTLAPYAMIPTPRRGEFDPGRAGELEHRSAVALARAERSALVLDIIQMLLPEQVLDDRDTVVALREALRLVPAEESSTFDMVIDVLDDMGADGNVTAKIVAGLLSDMREQPLAQLFFGRPPAGVLDTDAALTIITMGGLRLPNMNRSRRLWTVQETLAVPMLHLAHRLAVRRCYGGPMTSRKFVGLDEGHFLSGWESGLAFVDRLARDSRKWNLAALIASQNPKDILGLDVQNLVTTVFVGRIVKDREIAEEALRLLGAPVGVGYEGTLAGLSQLHDTSSTDRLGYREFVMRDVDGRTQKIRVDVSYIDGLLDVLNTTPGGTK